MADTDHDDEVLAAKATLTPVMPKSKGRFRCPLCGREERLDGNCPDDGIPLRRMPASER